MADKVAAQKAALEIVVGFLVEGLPNAAQISPCLQMLQMAGLPPFSAPPVLQLHRIMRRAALGQEQAARRAAAAVSASSCCCAPRIRAVAWPARRGW